MENTSELSCSWGEQSSLHPSVPLQAARGSVGTVLGLKMCEPRSPSEPGSPRAAPPGHRGCSSTYTTAWSPQPTLQDAHPNLSCNSPRNPHSTWELLQLGMKG